MTVLPNAPIDSATGLPVPTIAVATNGGVSVIKDDGTIVDYVGTSQGSDAPVDKISFIGSSRILFSHRYASEVVNIVSSDDSAGYYNQLSSFIGRITNSISHDDDTHVSALSSDDNIESIALNGEDAASKSVSGLSLANHYQEAGDPDRVSCFITSEYNTGWMNGDIKLATLSDTDTDTPASTNLVTNGTFDSTSNWTHIAGSTTTITGGEMVFTNGGGFGGFYQSIALVEGKSYTLSFDVTSYTQGGPVFSLADTAFGVTFSGTGSYSFVTAPIVGSDPYIRLYATGSAEFTIDNVSVRVAESDRSVNGKGLQVFGTVTKTAVATGADLVAYSGFSTTGAKINYLQQPHNSDLDFDTSFCFIGWVKVNAAVGTQDQHFFDLSPTTGSGRVNIYWNHASSAFDFVPGNGANAATTQALGYGGWNHLVCLANSSSTQIYLNGTLSATASGGFNHSLSSNAYLTLGTRYTEYNSSAYGLNGSLALIRLSKSTPSPEQIAKIYNDEKFLFQENAKATLYGTSDAVAALAYDDDTELLHVGTSAGRSVFRGLRRIDNTTDAVGAAISASNGMVAED
jgi:hypothetical protein